MIRSTTAAMTRTLPYGRAGIQVSFPAEMEIEWVQPDYGPGAPDAAALLAERLRHPIAARPLAEQARGARRVTIVIDDISRPTPSKQMLPAVLAELRAAGVAESGIRILVGVGSHRTMTPAEMETIVGPEIFPRYTVLNHQARDPQHLADIGRSPRGIPVWINRLVVESDLCILTGFIKPHNVAGYSGGYKGYFPAVSGIETIFGLHALQQLPGEPCRVGEIDNPFRVELDACGPLVPTPTFLLNTIINRQKQIVDAFAGDPMEAHRAAVAEAEKRATVPVSRPADVVVACGGYPSDISLYQGVNALTSVVRLRTPLVKPDGEVILLGEFSEGLGAEYDGTGRHKSLATAWASHLKKMRRLTVVSPNVPAQPLEAAGIAKAATAEEALARCAAGRATPPHVVVMPDAPYTVGRAG
ncbi:MAG TPA: nickel-dependent lactate racemase [Bryobacterales bacterium]|nr:nickel-dependent lactate racemase [Bryobacterales bacterium]